MQTPQKMPAGNVFVNTATYVAQELFQSPPKDESPKERVERIYRQAGGPLLGWLGDEAHKRGQTTKEMAETLGVTYGYFLQLCNGIRSTESAPQEFYVACSRYLGVPAVVCKLLAGNIRMSDFLFRAESEDDEVDRAFRKMMEDPTARSLLPSDTTAFSTEAKRAIVLMYTESAGQDILGVRQLPDIVHWLQRAAVQFDEASYQAWADLQCDGGSQS
jgi:hypothetical protein